MSFSWTQQSGPGTAIIVPGSLSGNALTTAVTLDVAGVYVLRLTATDGALSTFDDVQVTLLAENAPPASGDSPVLSGITGFWRFDENSGIQAADSSGQGNHGTLISLDNSHWQPGVYNSALCLDGTKPQEMAVSTTASAGLTSTSVTVAGWVNVNPALNTWAWVAGQGDNYGLVVNRRNKDDLLFYFYNGSTWRSVGVLNIGIRDGQWHHIAGSFDQSTGMTSIYMDGVLLKSTSFQESIVHSIGSGFSVGSMQGQRNFNGLSG